MANGSFRAPIGIPKKYTSITRYPILNSSATVLKVSNQQFLGDTGTVVSRNLSIVISVAENLLKNKVVNRTIAENKVTSSAISLLRARSAVLSVVSTTLLNIIKKSQRFSTISSLQHVNTSISSFKQRLKTLAGNVSTTYQTTLSRVKNGVVGMLTTTAQAIVKRAQRFEGLSNTITLSYSISKVKTVFKALSNTSVCTYIISGFDGVINFVRNLSHSVTVAFDVNMTKGRLADIDATTVVAQAFSLERLKFITNSHVITTIFNVINPNIPSFISYTVSCSRKIKTFFRITVSAKL